MSEAEPLPELVVVAIQQGRKIEAIKLLREATGLGLKEAKHAVDAYERRHPSTRPLARPSAESSIGRLVVVAVLAAAVVGAYLYFA